MRKNHSCGIYKIENLINHKIYIGQSIDIEKRWQRHIRDDDDYPLHRAIKKYGKENFDFTIIQLCKEQELNQKEIYYIKSFNSQTPNGYNITPGGQSGTGVIKRKPVEQYSLSGDFIREYQSVKAAGQDNNINPSNIGSCCNGLRKQAGPFQWKYKDSEKEILPIENALFRDSVLQYDLKGNFIREYDCLASAAKETNICKSSICSACKGKVKTAGGYQWKYKHSDKIITEKEKTTLKKPTKSSHGGIIQYNLQGKPIAYFPTAIAAKRATGVNNSDIGSVCKGKRASAGGYLWKFADEVEGVDIDKL